MSDEPHLDGEIRDGRHVMLVRVYYQDNDLSVMGLRHGHDFIQQWTCGLTSPREIVSGLQI
jgi:hypothetical protein